MPDVLIITDPVPSPSQPSAMSAIAAEMKRAVLALGSSSTAKERPIQVEVRSISELSDLKESNLLNQPILCPLTFKLPLWIPFTAREVFAACEHVEELQQQVSGWGVAIGSGVYWLPIVLTAKGPLYAEAISLSDRSSSAYHQPFHLTDAQRQPLYALGNRLLRSLNASSGVYLVQFGWDGNQVQFDRLIPFPDRPAIASVGVQTPDLFTCHWQCLTHQPIRDLSVLSAR
ncbi:MAG: hypothetical protein IGS48_03390 [Oscillatoriales cyanobacterium C42_A2020_001]|nr:hypothetical protein [Leptolyngbyaceae cyanobacterium C42_A2020_001]